MAATKNLIAYGAGTQITCSIASLATGTTRESNTVSNTASNFFDCLVSLTFTLASGSPSTASQGAINIYANASVDGTLWPIIMLSNGTVKATGAGDASIGALANPNSLQCIGSFYIQTTTSSAERTFRTPAYSLAQAFNGTLPQAFSIMIENQLGIALSTSTVTTANYLEYEGVYSTSGN
jgi:hypothetical protein